MASNLDRPWCWSQGNWTDRVLYHANVYCGFLGTHPKSEWLSPLLLGAWQMNSRHLVYIRFCMQQNFSANSTQKSSIKSANKFFMKSKQDGDQQEMNAWGKNLIYGMLLVWCYARLNNKTRCLPFPKRASYLSATRIVACLNSTCVIFQ